MQESQSVIVQSSRVRLVFFLFLFHGLIVGLNAAESVRLLANGGWCWYQDERALIVNNSVFFSSVKAPEGDVDISRWDLATGGVESHTLASGFEADDHVVAALLLLPDKRILAAWSGHGGVRPRDLNRFINWAVTENPLDITTWGFNASLEASYRSTSYNNLQQLSGEGGRIYDFHRGNGYNPNYLISDNNGLTFKYGGRLLSWPKPGKTDLKYTGMDGGRPYAKYSSDGVGRIHFITTEDHPRAYHNSIWHGYIEDGEIHNSDGKIVGLLSQTAESEISPTDLTLVYPGDGDHVAWTVDLELDAKGNPVALFSVQMNNANVEADVLAGGDDIRYFYARWADEEWIADQLAFGGSCLYPKENDYSGLCAIVPHDPNIVYISTNADPLSGSPLLSSKDGQRHYEIFKGVTNDLGKSWTWTAITKDSVADNIRPIVPRNSEGKTAVLWLRGDFRTYRDYDLAVMGLVDEG